MLESPKNVSQPGGVAAHTDTTGQNNMTGSLTTEGAGTKV